MVSIFSDVDECISNTDDCVNAVCANTVGTYTCTPNDGYKLAGIIYDGVDYKGIGLYILYY